MFNVNGPLLPNYYKYISRAEKGLTRPPGFSQSCHFCPDKPSVQQKQTFFEGQTLHLCFLHLWTEADLFWLNLHMFHIYRKSRSFGYLGIFGCLLADIGPVHGIVLLHLHRLHLLLDCVHGRAVKPLVENSMSIMNVFWWKGNLWGWGAPEAGTETGWMGWVGEGGRLCAGHLLCCSGEGKRGAGELTWIIFWDITHFNFSTSYSIDSVYQQCTIVLWVKSGNRGD